MAEVFLSNIEAVLNPNGPVEGDLARKVSEVSSRGVWYGHDAIVLPSQPDPEFLDYTASLGAEPEVIVPQTIDLNRLSIIDGFVDPRVQRAVRGNHAESYILDPSLFEIVQQAGGVYGNGEHPGEAIAIANDKGNYAHFAEGLVLTPPGTLEHGLPTIAHVVQTRLAHGLPTFVRHTRSGGGFGNRYFPADQGVPSLAEIEERLADGHRDLWEEGSALVEDVLTLQHSPGVAFHTDVGTAYDFDQITRETSYVGAWSPTPEWIADPDQLRSLGDTLAQRLGAVGFYGWADTDLGTTDDAVYGFEINGRSDGVRHIVTAAERLVGPWHTWRESGVVTKAVDSFKLRAPAQFRDVHAALAAENMLATPDNPFGTVITIPPVGNVAGIQVLGPSYEAAEARYRRVVDAIGDPTANQEDHPLFV